MPKPEGKPKAMAARSNGQPEFTPMKLTCTVCRLPDGKWLARHTGTSVGPVEVRAPTRDEVLTKLRDELQYRIELCPCSGAWGDTVELQVREEGARP
jgi:hypothetical protein